MYLLGRGIVKKAFDTKSQLAFAHGAKSREPLTQSVFNMFRESLEDRATDPKLSKEVQDNAALVLRRAESAVERGKPLDSRERKALSSVFEAAPGKAGYADPHYANRAVFTGGSAHNRQKQGQGLSGAR